MPETQPKESSARQPKLPSKERMRTWLDHLPDSVVKKFKLRERLLGENSTPVATQNQNVETEAPDPAHEQIKKMTLADIDQDRWFDPELIFFTIEEIQALQHQLEYRVVGINLTFTADIQQAHFHLEDQVCPVDIQGYREGDISLGFSFVPDSMEQPLRSGQYDLMLGNSSLSVQEGQSSSFGHVRIEKMNPELARNEAEQMLQVAHIAMEQFLHDHKPPISQKELFASIKNALAKSKTENFVFDNSNNAQGFE